MTENDEGEAAKVQVYGSEHWLQWIENSDKFDDINLEEVVPNEFEDGCDDADSSVQHIPSAKMKVVKLVAFLDKMKPACDDVMRSTRVHRLLQCFGRVFWAKDHDFFHLSELTKDFDEFVSHSWHVKAWKKVMLLMILKNGMPAVLAGFLAAFLMALLWQLDFLPTYITSANTSSISCWCLTAGLLMSLVILLFWRAKGSVFLDRVCIHQKDLRRKTEGVMSIGAILKASHSILVIFDESYVDRLWCVFELAAFLKAHPDLSGAESMKVQPVLLGFASFSVAITCSLTGFVALFSVKLGLWFSWILTFGVLGLEGNFLISAFRSYFRTLEESTHRLSEFQVHKAVCYCCSVNHHDPTTQNEIDVCDREVVQMCVSSWFGSTTDFEATVRSQVAEALKHQVGSDAFPYAWILGSSAPLMWMLLDLIASYLKDETLHFMVPFWIIRGFAWWLWGVPTLATIGLFGARRLRAKGGSLLAENCRNLLVVVGTLPVVVVLVLWQIVTEVLFHKKDDTLGSLIFAFGVLILFLITRLAYRRSIRNKDSKLTTR